MSSQWRPDDSLMQRDAKGEVRGALRVRTALKKNKVPAGNRVITSRDTGMAAARRDLKRERTPRGVEQWQVPIILGPGADILLFQARHRPGAKIPEHTHTGAVMHVVTRGSLKHRGRTLKAGDWILVPAGESYSLDTGADGVETMYFHFPWPWPWWPL